MTAIQRNPAQTLPTVGLLFELETLLVNGRELCFEVIKNALAHRDVPFSSSLFSKYCINSDAPFFVPHILEATGRKRICAEKLSQEIEVGSMLAFSRGQLKVSGNFVKMLEFAAQAKMKVGALTCLTDDVAGTLIEKLGLRGKGITLHVSKGCEQGRPTSECWRELSRLVTVPASRCIALASSSMSCKAALRAGMRCIGSPDQYTSFEDFSGADMIAETLGAPAIRDLLSQMR